MVAPHMSLFSKTEKPHRLNFETGRQRALRREEPQHQRGGLSVQKFCRNLGSALALHEVHHGIRHPLLGVCLALHRSALRVLVLCNPFRPPFFGRCFIRDKNLAVVDLTPEIRHDTGANGEAGDGCVQTKYFIAIQRVFKILAGYLKFNSRFIDLAANTASLAPRGVKSFFVRKFGGANYFHTLPVFKFRVSNRVIRFGLQPDLITFPNFVNT